jgi:serine/threonine-protein kinase
MPTALKRPRRLNPDISLRVEAAILAAMALHPSRRPANVAVFREQLLGTAPIAADPDLMTAETAWRLALWDNAGLIALAVLLLLLAVLATWQAVAG